MAINVGYIEGMCSNAAGGAVVVRIYYDATMDPAGPQTLIDGPRGWCLDVANTTGAKSTLIVSGLTANPLTVTVGKGDPVTTGPASGRSRTAADLAALGFTTRDSVGNFALSCTN